MSNHQTKQGKKTMNKKTDEECPICGYTKGMKDGTIKTMFSFLLEDFTVKAVEAFKKHIITEFLKDDPPIKCGMKECNQYLFLQEIDDDGFVFSCENNECSTQIIIKLDELS